MTPEELSAIIARSEHPVLRWNALSLQHDLAHAIRALQKLMQQNGERHEAPIEGEGRPK